MPCAPTIRYYLNQMRRSGNSSPALLQCEDKNWDEGATVALGTTSSLGKTPITVITPSFSKLQNLSTALLQNQCLPGQKPLQEFRDQLRKNYFIIKEKSAHNWFWLMNKREWAPIRKLYQHIYALGLYIPHRKFLKSFSHLAPKHLTSTTSDLSCIIPRWSY